MCLATKTYQGNVIWSVLVFCVIAWMAMIGVDAMGTGPYPCWGCTGHKTLQRWHHSTTSLEVRIWADSVQDLCKGSVQWASEVFQMIDGMYKVGFEALGQGG